LNKIFPDIFPALSNPTSSSDNSSVNLPNLEGIPTIEKFLELVCPNSGEGQMGPAHLLSLVYPFMLTEKYSSV